MKAASAMLSLLLGCTLSCSGTSTKGTSEAADAFEIHLAVIDGLASVPQLAREMGPDQAREVLQELASRDQFVLLDKDRLCVKGSIRFGKGGAFTGQTLDLRDLSQPEGWNHGACWLPGDMLIVIDSMHFEPEALVVAWHGTDEVAKTLVVPWAPGELPPSGTLK